MTHAVIAPRPGTSSGVSRRLARRLPILLALAGVLAGPIAGCSAIPWLTGGKDPTPPTKLETLAQETTLNVLWSERPTKGSEGRRLDLVPALGGGRIYVAGARGRVAALDATSGRVLWERDTKIPFSSGPDLDRDRLILGTSGGEVVALSTADGREIWRTQLTTEVLAVPRHSGEGRVIARTLDDTVVALDAANGKELWRVSYPAPVLTLRGSGTPAIVPGGIVVGLSGGKLIKLDPTDGAPLWEVMVTAPSGRSELARIADIDADPVVVGTLVFVGTYNGDLAAVDLETGNVLWRRQLSSYAGLAANESALFVTDSEDRVWGAEPASGAGRWKQERLLHRQLTAPTPVGNLIAVGDLEGWVHLLAQSDGRLVGRTRVSKKGAIRTAPVAAGGRLYVYASDGTVAALTPGAAPPGARRGGSGAAEGGAKADIPTDGGLPSSGPVRIKAPGLGNAAPGAPPPTSP